MRKITLTIAFLLLVMALALPAGAQQDGRINPSVVDLAIYCAGDGGISVWVIEPSGEGVPAFEVRLPQVQSALATANGRSEVVVARGANAVLTALPSAQLRADLDDPDRKPYTFTFAGDRCGPMDMNAPQFGGAVVGAPSSNGGGGASSDGGGSAAPTGTATYVVVRGDTLRNIANRFGVSVGDIVAANGIANPDRIFPGQQFTIPNQPEVAAPAGDANSGGGDAPAAAPPPADPNAANFLVDGGFDSNYTGRGRPDFNIPAAWQSIVYNSPQSFYWQNIDPFAFPRRDGAERRSGAFSLNMNRGFGTYTVTLYQRASVPANETVNGSVWAWYHTCDAGSQNCNNSSNPRVRVGLDPTGGTNPGAPTVQWSGFISPQGGWGNVGTSVQAQGSVVTMFINATQDSPRAINELYLDEAVLARAG